MNYEKLTFVTGSDYLAEYWNDLKLILDKIGHINLFKLSILGGEPIELGLTLDKVGIDGKLFDTDFQKYKEQVELFQDKIQNETFSDGGKSFPVFKNEINEDKNRVTLYICKYKD